MLPLSEQVPNPTVGRFLASQGLLDKPCGMNRQRCRLPESTHSELSPAHTSRRIPWQSSFWAFSLDSAETVVGALHHLKRTYVGTGPLVLSVIFGRLHRF